MTEPHRFCAACGKELVPDGSFCPFCGVRVGGSEPTHQGRTVGEWLEELVSHDGAARTKALRALERLGSKADAAVAKLAGALAEPLPEGLPAEALLQLGRHVDAAVSRIVDGMTRDESVDVRMTNFGSLMKCGERAAPAAPVLRERLRDALRGTAAYPDVPGNLARALGWIGPKAAEAVPELLDALRHPESELREAAAWSLGRIGSKARSAIPLLQEASKDPDPGVAREARKSLKLVR